MYVFFINCLHNFMWELSDKYRYQSVVINYVLLILFCQSFLYLVYIFYTNKQNNEIHIRTHAHTTILVSFLAQRVFCI